MSSRDREKLDVMASCVSLVQPRLFNSIFVAVVETRGMLKKRPLHISQRP